MIFSLDRLSFELFINLTKMIRTSSLCKRGFFNNTGSTRLVSGIQNWGFIVIVGEKYATLIHRFQKFDRQLSPGLNFKIPIIENVAYSHDLREQVFEITSQVAVTKDNVALHIDGVLYIQVVDAMKASYGVEDFKSAVINLA